MQLYDEHIDIISQRLTADGIKDPRLHADLLDHICTYIEEAEEDNFEILLLEAMQLLAPDGMHEIEEERFFLFHFHKQLTMKKILFFSGFAATFLFTTGFTFKLMHWPGASMILILGYLGVILTSGLIAANALRNNNRHSPATMFRIFAGVAAALLISVGSIFKLQHWPTASIQFVLGIFVLNFFFLPMFFYQLYRQSVSRI